MRYWHKLSAEPRQRVWGWVIRLVYPLVALFLFVLLFVLFDPIMNRYVEFLLDKILWPLKLPYLPQPIFLFLALMIMTAPFVVVLVIWYLVWTKRRSDEGSVFEKQLLGLAEVQSRLSEAQTFTQRVTQEIAQYQKRYSELTDLIQTVDELAKESDEKLRKKLAAIERTTARRENLRLAVSFMLGFVASLLASAVWNFLLAGRLVR